MKKEKKRKADIGSGNDYNYQVLCINNLHFAIQT